MNKTQTMIRLTADPEVRYSSDGKANCHFVGACPRRFKREETDFINFVAFGKDAEFLEKYCRKGTKLVIIGHIQTGSYTNKDGNKVYTTDVICEEIEFAESKNANSGYVAPNNESNTDADGFMNIPDGIEQELPFV